MKVFQGASEPRAMNESLYSCKRNPTHGATIKEIVFVNNCGLGAKIFTRERKETCHDKYESELYFEYLQVYLV